MVLYHAGDMAGAIMQQHKELIINERCLGSDHPDTAHRYSSCLVMNVVFQASCAFCAFWSYWFGLNCVTCLKLMKRELQGDANICYASFSWSILIFSVTMFV